MIVASDTEIALMPFDVCECAFGGGRVECRSQSEDTVLAHNVTSFQGSYDS